VSAVGHAGNPCYHPAALGGTSAAVANALERERLSTPLRRILILLALSIFVNYVDRGNLSIAAPLIKNELGLSPSQLGILLSSFFWTYTAFQIPVGWLVDRFDVSLVLALGFFIWSAATAATGLMRGFAALLAVRLVLGMGEAVAYPSYSKILARDFSAGHRGIANGAIAAGQTSGPAFSIFLGGMLVARFGWRPFFLTLGLLGLLWLIPWMRWRPRNPEIAPAGLPAVTPSLLSVLKQRDIWGACVGHFAGNYLIYFLLTWLPSYLVSERNYSLGKTGRIAGIAFLMCAASSAITGALSDRWIAAGASPTRVRKTLLVTGLGGAGIILVLCVLASPSLSIILLFTASTLYGICNPNTFASAQILAGPLAAGKWMGFQNFVGNFAGIVAPALTGFLVDKTGHFFWAFAVTGAICLLGSFSWIYIVGAIEPVKWPAATS
jgi:ACS family D-galactonate transporter-like MFS transporter